MAAPAASPSCLTQLARRCGAQVKALYRRYQARFARQEYDEAMADVKQAHEIDPKNTDVYSAVMGTKFAMRVADRAQKAQFGGMFQSKQHPGQSTELYKEEMGIPPWHGALPTAWLDLSVDGKVCLRAPPWALASDGPRSPLHGFLSPLPITWPSLSIPMAWPFLSPHNMAFSLDPYGMAFSLSPQHGLLSQYPWHALLSPAHLR